MAGACPVWPSALARNLAFRPTPANQGSNDGPRADATLAGACLDLPREVGVNDVALDPERLTSLLCGRDDPFWAKVK